MLTSGKAILSYGIIREDIFFVDSGHKLVIQQWLYDILLFKVYEFFGKPGIFLMTLLLSLLFIFFAVRAMRYYRVDIRISITAVLLVCIFSFGVFTIRPGLVTMVLLLIQICICERFKKSGNPASLFLLPLLTLSEINLHSTMWIAHFIFLLPYLVPVPDKLKKHIKLTDNHISIKKLAMPLLCMAISLFVNPYGLDGITILFKQGDISSLRITELNSPKLTSIYAIVFILVLVVSAVLYGKTTIHSNNAFMLLGTSLLMMLHLRNLQMYSIGLIAILCDLLVLIPEAKLEKPVKKYHAAVAAVCTVLCFIALGILLKINLPYYSFKDEPHDNVHTPVRAVKYLDEHAEKDARIYTDFNGGSYISWNGYKIYFCSRTEGYCKDGNGGFDLVNEYNSIYSNKDTHCIDIYKTFLMRYDFDYLVVETENSMFPYLAESDEYKAVLYGNGYAVFMPEE